MKTCVFILLTFVATLGVAQVSKPEVKKVEKVANPFKIEREGSGGMSGSFPGFNEVSSKKLSDAITMATDLIDELKIDGDMDFQMIHNLRDEITGAKYIQMKNRRIARPNRFPGDYNWGGFLAASTRPFPGSSTDVYPEFLDNDSVDVTQVTQMVIEEALHRALPEPTNRYERIVKSITRIITKNSGDKNLALKQYLKKVKNVKLPWHVNYEISGNPGHIPYLKQALQKTGRVVETASKARVTIKFYSRAYGSGEKVVFYDNYNHTSKILATDFMWKRRDMTPVGEYDKVVNFILQELKNLEFMQSL